MEERKTIFDYLGQVFMIFGITITILNVFCLMFGEDAQEFSTMFAFGKQGISVSTMMQFLVVSAITVFANYLFYTDIFIKNMTIALRTVCMIIAEIILIVVFVLNCGWFPADMWQPWAMFALCFGICFAVSLSITVLKERLENKKMEEALERLKKQEEQER